jgi:hypothetical protein
MNNQPPPLVDYDVFLSDRALVETLKHEGADASFALFRESPLNSIWEGSGNINAVDLLRSEAAGSDACVARESAGLFGALLESRIAGLWGRTFGTLAPSQEHARIVQRARPHQSVEYTAV